jgi:hypothetical protein
MKEKHMPDSASFHAKANLAKACTGDLPIQDGLRPGMTIEQILADPMVRAVMLADHVKPESFVTLLRSVTRTRGHQTEAGPGQPGRSMNDKQDQRRDLFLIPIERN